MEIKLVSPVALAVILVSALVWPPTALPAHHAQLVVDDDKVECPHAGFTHIQNAIDAASPGDEIHICKGIYVEQVTIRKPLNIEADNGIEWQQNNRLYIARGNARATRGQATVFADTLMAFYRPVCGPEAREAEKKKAAAHKDAPPGKAPAAKAQTIAASLADQAAVSTMIGRTGGSSARSFGAISGSDNANSSVLFRQFAKII